MRGWPDWWAPVVADFDARVRRFLVSLAARGFQAYPSSGYRTFQENLRVGGDAMSQHQIGTARDLVPSSPSAANFRTLYLAARASGLFGWVQDESVTTMGTGPHIHVQLFAKGQLGPELYAQLLPAFGRENLYRA